MKTTDVSKISMQQRQYFEPYHHYVSLSPFSLHKSLSWGVEYYSYITSIISCLERVEFDSLLDIGCGDGFMLNYLSTLYPQKRFIGIDTSEQAILFARAYQKPGAVNTFFITQDLEGVTDTFDVITLIEVLEHIPDESIGPFIDTVKERLSEKGLLIVSVPTTNIPLSKKHYRHYHLDLLKEQLDGLEIRDYYYVYNSNNYLLKIVKWFLCNKFFILNSKTTISFLLGRIKKGMFEVKQTEGAHLICICSRKR